MAVELRGIAEILGDERFEFRGDEFRDVVDLLDPKAFMTENECIGGNDYTLVHLRFRGQIRSAVPGHFCVFYLNKIYSKYRKITETVIWLTQSSANEIKLIRLASPGLSVPIYRYIHDKLNLFYYHDMANENYQNHCSVALSNLNVDSLVLTNSMNSLTSQHFGSLNFEKPFRGIFRGL